MSNLKEEFSRIRQSAGQSYSLCEVFEQLYAAMQNHQDELCGIDASLAIKATDTGNAARFLIENGHVSIPAENAPVAVTVSGTENNLVAFIRGELSPTKAILFRKIIVQGDIGALSKLSKFL